MADSALVEWVSSNPGFGAITIYDLQGMGIASSDPNSVGRMEGHREDIQAALSGEQYTEKIRLSPVGDIPGFFISTPLMRGPNIVGVLSARLNADFIETSLAGDLENTAESADSEDYREDTNTFIVNSYGIVLVHSEEGSDWLFRSLGGLDDESLQLIQEQSLVGGTCPGGGETCEFSEVVSRTPETIPAVQPLGDALKEVFETGKGSDLRYCYPASVEAALDDDCSQGAWHTAAFEPANDPIRDEVLFVIVVDVPEEAFLDTFRQQALIGIGSGVFITLLLIVTSVMVARSMARPIRKLADVAQAVEQEEIFEPESLADITQSEDEIGRLARVFSAMVVAVQKREQKLKAQVQSLRIQIDEGRKQEELDDIVKGEFFQDLQAKAKEFRKKKREDQEEGEGSDEPDEPEK